MAYYSATDTSPSKYLSGIGFQFSLKKLPGVSYYCQSATVPSLNLAVANQATRWKSLREPGDEMNFDELSKGNSFISGSYIIEISTSLLSSFKIIF